MSNKRLQWKQRIFAKDQPLLSSKFVWMQLAGVACLIFLLWIGVFAAASLSLALSARFWGLTCFILLLFSVVAVGVSYSYWEVYRRTYLVFFDGFRIVFRKGVFRPSFHSTGVVSFNSHYVEQTWLDILFGVYRLRIYGTAHPGKQYVEIPAMTAEDAQILYDFLTAELNRQTFLPSSVVEFELPVSDHQQFSSSGPPVGKGRRVA